MRLGFRLVKSLSACLALGAILAAGCSKKPVFAQDRQI